MGKVKFKRNALTSRDLRRMGEREQRRQQSQAAIDAFWALSPEERAQRIADQQAFQQIQRNGITLEDLKRAEDQGRQDGFMAGKMQTLKLCYAAFCLALHEKHGFGAKRCMDVLNVADEKLTYALTDDELVQQVWDEMELDLVFKGEIGSRVQMKGVG